VAEVLVIEELVAQEQRAKDLLEEVQVLDLLENQIIQLLAAAAQVAQEKVQPVHAAATAALDLYFLSQANLLGTVVAVVAIFNTVQIMVVTVVAVVVAQDHGVKIEAATTDLTALLIQVVAVVEPIIML
jgi:hypothetical protein